MRLTTEHREDHEWMTEWVVEGWLGDAGVLHAPLAAHLGRFHGCSAKDIANNGLTPMLIDHDHAHGGSDVLEIEEHLAKMTGMQGLREGLATERKRLGTQ